MSSTDRSSEGGRVRRLLGRALVVTGTVAAGTTVAWAVGTGMPAHASSQDGQRDGLLGEAAQLPPVQDGLVPGGQDLGRLLDPDDAHTPHHQAPQQGAHGSPDRASTPRSGAVPSNAGPSNAGPSGTAPPGATPSSKDESHQVRHHQLRLDQLRPDELEHGPESSPLQDLDPAALLPSFERSHSQGQPEADRGPSGGAEHSTSDSAGRSADRSAGQADVLAPVQKSVEPVTRPVVGAVDGVVHAVRPVLEPAGDAVARVGEHPEQLPRAVDTGLADLGRPLWMDPGAPPAPALPHAEPPAPAAPVAAAAPAPEHHQAKSSPHTGKTAAHHGKAQHAHAARDDAQHPQEQKAPGHHPLDLAVPGAPAPGTALDGHAPGDTGLGWCPEIPHPQPSLTGVLVPDRDHAASGTCGSQPGTTPD